jgi:hypothetical protein
MAQQTAVRWLIDKLGGFKTKDGDVAFIGVIPKDLIEKAEQMEKEQIEDAYIMGSYDMASKEFKPGKYYNETYGIE